MDSEQAKIILSAWCPDGDATQDDAPFEQALAQLETDPALAEWFAEQNAMDAGMRDALRTIVPPAHLREAILSANKVTAFPEAKTRRFSLVWLAVAAALVLAAVGVSFFPPASGGGLSIAQLDAEIPRLNALHEHGFASKTGNLEAVRSWLAANGGMADFGVPEGLKNRGAVGCEVTSIKGTKVSILCFHLGEGRTAHLYVVDRADLSTSPTLDVPSFRQQGTYAVASWSHGDKSYFLARSGDESAVRSLL